ncbi:MAG TPA: hypothetical protein VLH86_06155 [Patescibacteria group bacterium]|nr:hypothetical protein [Patescibacteria group bacterium]
MKHPITSTRNGIPVYVDLVKSQAGAHIARQPYLLGLVKELLATITATEAEISIEHDMGRAVGYSYVVETTDKDNIVYAQRLHDDAYTRFVKNGTPLSTNYLSIVLRRDADGDYELDDAWVGRLNPPRPGSANETANSKVYWTKHAFVLDGQPIQLRTLTKVCPY